MHTLSSISVNVPKVEWDSVGIDTLINVLDGQLPNASPDDQQKIKKILEGFKILEPQALKGSLFLDKGYSLEVENALQILRNKVMTFVIPKENDFLKVKFDECLMTWVYKQVSTLSCIDPNSYPIFVQAVENNNPQLMFSCLNWTPILENALKDLDFIQAIETVEKVVKDPEFLQILKNDNRLTPDNIKTIEDFQNKELLESVKISINSLKFKSSNGRLTEKDAERVIQMIKKHGPTLFFSIDDSDPKAVFIFPHRFLTIDYPITANAALQFISDFK